MGFNAAETAACTRLVELAFDEDLGPVHTDIHDSSGDITTRAIIPRDLPGRAVFVARADGVIAGLPAVALAFQTARTPLLKFEPFIQDGDRVKRGDRLGVVTGLMEFILIAERTALNFLQHLSGISTLTRKFVDAVEGLPCQILDTRKTLPGWRLLQKYAVRCGGGRNHRMGLYDAILIKDNHLAAIQDKDWGHRIEHAVHAAYKANPAAKIEIEVERIEQVWVALDCRPHLILLDNMGLDSLRKAVKSRNAECENEEKLVQLEASGGVTLENVRAIAETGVDRISVGALTHSAPALDIALDYEAL
jgi:nicotinate-nucleotide pyrophosphorylase (carboxylating)